MKHKPTKPSPAMIARILKAMPVTKDGVPMYVGMFVWYRFASGKVQKLRVSELGMGRSYVLRSETGGSYAYADFLFSSRAAALAEVKRRNGRGK